MNGCAAWAIIITAVVLSIAAAGMNDDIQRGQTNRAAIAAGLHQSCGTGFDIGVCHWEK